MAYEIPGKSITLVAAADLSASQFRCITTDANGAGIAPSAGGTIIGVRQNRPSSGQAVTVMTSGVSIVEAGGAIPLISGGTPVKTDAAGKVVAQGGTGVAIGLALEAATGDGIFIAVQLTNVAA